MHEGMNGIEETDGMYYFNRCRRCNGLITKLESCSCLATSGESCGCGSACLGLTNPIRLEWFKPRMLKMVVWQLLGKLAPAAHEPCPAYPRCGPVSRRCLPLSADEIRAPEEGEK